MGKGLIILILVVVGFVYLMNSDTPDTNTTTGAGPTYLSNTTSYDDDVNLDDEEEAEEKVEDTTEETNECGGANTGYADYTGTEKEGLYCSDALPSERDNECILNPPIGYDGTINLANMESDPPLTCCAQDGTCQW
jgi:hypothetical protein